MNWTSYCTSNASEFLWPHGPRYFPRPRKLVMERVKHPVPHVAIRFTDRVNCPFKEMKVAFCHWVLHYVTFKSHGTCIEQVHIISPLDLNQCLLNLTLSRVMPRLPPLRLQAHYVHGNFTTISFISVLLLFSSCKYSSFQQVHASTYTASENSWSRNATYSDQVNSHGHAL